MKILTVCGMGNGSSLILKINVDDKKLLSKTLTLLLLKASLPI